MTYSTYMPGPERRQQILQGAKRAFATRGYHQTNISHICHDLGIGRGTLYQYFGSKREVFAAIIEDLLERLRIEIETRPSIEIPPEVEPSPEMVIQFSAQRLERILQVVFADQDSLRILLREAVGLDVQIDTILRAIDAIVIDACAADIGLAQELGLIRSDVDSRFVAVLIVGAVEKLAIDALGKDRGGDGLDIRRMADQVTRIHLLGILNRNEKEER